MTKSEFKKVLEKHWNSYENWPTVEDIVQDTMELLEDTVEPLCELGCYLNKGTIIEPDYEE